MIFQLLIFLVSGLLVWRAGTTLTKTTDCLDCRYKLGQAFGGLILLGITGNLTDITVALSAALHGQIPVIIGNLIGGIAIQTLLIVIFDFAVKGRRPLSYLAGSLTLFFETLFAIALVLIAIAATYVPARDALFHINPLSIGIVAVWLIGLYLIDKAHKISRFNKTEDNADPGRLHNQCRIAEESSFYAGKRNTYVMLVFALASVVTLIAGYFLETSGTALAVSLGMNTGVFAATILALVTSLPELSTGLEAVMLGDNHMAFSDIWGGNAFMIVPFIAADLLAGKPVLSYAQNSDRLIAALGVVMMAVYALAFLKKLRRRYFRLGLDSILEILLYAGGIILLFHLG
jgi:cation:H+ antiporter